MHALTFGGGATTGSVLSSRAIEASRGASTSLILAGGTILAGVAASAFECCAGSREISVTASGSIPTYDALILGGSWALTPAVLAGSARQLGRVPIAPSTAQGLGVILDFASVVLACRTAVFLAVQTCGMA